MKKMLAVLVVLLCVVGLVTCDNKNGGTNAAVKSNEELYSLACEDVRDAQSAEIEEFVALTTAPITA